MGVWECGSARAPLRDWRMLERIVSRMWHTPILIYSHTTLPRETIAEGFSCKSGKVATTSPGAQRAGKFGHPSMFRQQSSDEAGDAHRETIAARRAHDPRPDFDSEV